MTQPAHELALHQIYAEEFRKHAIMLIWLGYRRLNAPSMVNAEEDAITGALAREMEFVAEDPESPDWVDQCEVHEQSRQHVEGKTGKGRPIIDVEIRRHCRGSRFRLGFEAKRLGPKNHTIGSYLGREGLAAFVTGYYPTPHGEAGMLGYVQEKSCDHWASKLSQKFSDDSAEHRIAADGQLQRFDIEPNMPAFRSLHIGANDKPLLVVHVLLAFTS